MERVFTEIANLGTEECFRLAERRKNIIRYPLHKHKEYELNFIENCQRARRIVGDSMEEVGYTDLALVGSGLEHTWEQYRCKATDIHEITIHFSGDLLSETFLAKDQMRSLRQLFINARFGIAFSEESIARLRPKILGVANARAGFYRVLALLELLYLMSIEDYHLLASKSFARAFDAPDSRRVCKVQAFIDTHYREEIRLAQLSELVGMSQTAFSRFFHQHANRTVSDYIIDIRLGHAARLLVDSSSTVAEICYQCGFNNLSNFNRIFKKKKGCSPSAFREEYKRSKGVGN